MSFPNVYTHRKVAETAAKSCDVCFKPSSSVLVTPENKDFFYVCPTHLKDRNFCTPIIDQAAIDAKKKRELEEEIERVKKDYEERQKKKKEKETKEDKAKDKEESKDKDKNEDKDKKDDDKKSETKPGDKAKEDEATPPADEEPRVFELKKPFYQQRIEKKRQLEIAKRNRERIQQANFFPSVPTSLPKGKPGGS